MYAIFKIPEVVFSPSGCVEVDNETVDSSPLSVLPAEGTAVVSKDDTPVVSMADVVVVSIVLITSVVTCVS